MYIHIHANLPVNVIVRLPHPRSGDSQGFQHPLLTSKPTTMTQSGQTTIFFSILYFTSIQISYLQIYK